MVEGGRGLDGTERGTSMARLTTWCHGHEGLEAGGGEIWGWHVREAEHGEILTGEGGPGRRGEDEVK